MQKITTFLTYEKQAEEAVKLYTSIFKDSKVTATTRYPEGSPGPAGQVMTVEFELAGQQFIALNGGPSFKFSQAISLMVACETQAEIDDVWAKLSADGGQEVECGWVTDKFGVSWQIVPAMLMKMMKDKDARKAERVLKAVWTMKKLDLAAIKRAYEG